MSARRALGLALVLACITPRIAPARDLYVGPSAPAAADSNPGTRERPFKTIAGAVQQARAGDTVWIAAGTYRETVIIPRGGTGPDRRLVLRAEAAGEVVLKGSDVVTGWEPAGRGIWKRRGWKINSQQVFVDGQPLKQIGATCPFNSIQWGSKPILPATGSGVGDMTPGSFYWDQRSTTLHVRLAGDADPRAHLVEASVRNVVMASGPIDFVELRGLRFSHSNTSSVPVMMGLVNVEGRSWVIQNCAFTYGDFAGLSLSGEGHRIIDNVFNHNGNLGLSISGSDASHGWKTWENRPPQDLVIDGNETSDNNYRGFEYAFQAGGLKAATSCNGVRVTRHRAARNVGVGIWFDIRCQGVTVERSVVTENTVGIGFETSDGGLIAENVVARNDVAGIAVFAANDVIVAHNTVDGNGYGVVVHGLPRAEHPELKRNVVRNNILAHSRQADLVVLDHPPEAAGNRSDENVFFQPGGGVAIAWTSGPSYAVTHRDLREFSRLTGQDARSIVADPRWVDRARGDYRLKPGSPAAAAGVREPATSSGAPATGAATRPTGSPKLPKVR